MFNLTQKVLNFRLNGYNIGELPRFTSDFVSTASINIDATFDCEEHPLPPRPPKEVTEGSFESLGEPTP